MDFEFFDLFYRDLGRLKIEDISYVTRFAILHQSAQISGFDLTLSDS